MSYRSQLNRILTDREEAIDDEVYRRMHQADSDNYDRFYREVVDEIEDSLVDAFVD